MRRGKERRSGKRGKTQTAQIEQARMKTKIPTF